MHVLKISLSFVLFASLNIFYSEAALDLYLFNVGHGNFILLKNDNEALIVDAGSKTLNPDELWKSIAETFKACLGEATLKGIIITHDHNDHKCFIDAIKTTLAQKIPIFLGEKAANGKETLQKLFSNLTFNFLEPKTNLSALKDNSNDQSLVFSISYINQHIFFTGDATGTSFSNYLSQYDENDSQRVEKNRAILRNTTLYIMPHHGSSSENSWRWTLLIGNKCQNLKATFICCDPQNNTYHLPQEWIRDITWPESMKSTTKGTHIEYYNDNGSNSSLLKKTIKYRFYITGLASSYNMETQQYLHLHIDDGGNITYPDGPEEINNQQTNNGNPPSDSNFEEIKEQEINDEKSLMEIDTEYFNGNNEYLNTNISNSEISEISIIINKSESKKHNRKSSPTKAIKPIKVSKKIQNSFDQQNMINNQKKSKIKKTLKGKDKKIEY